jgi:hypothetical protein
MIFLIALEALVVAVRLGIVERRLKGDEDERKARRCDERERVLDPRRLGATSVARSPGGVYHRRREMDW